jgi:hypothetical protein
MRNKNNLILMLLAIIVLLSMVFCYSKQAISGNLEPSAAPGSTMKTLDQIPPTWSQILPTSERFELVMGGAAVLDKETGLVWEQSPDTTTRIWDDACNHCYMVTVGGRKGWRPPRIEELASLMDPSQIPGPTLPSGYSDFFNNVQSAGYWSLSTYAPLTPYAWVGSFFSGHVIAAIKGTALYYVWCVRGGQGYDGY